MNWTCEDPARIVCLAFSAPWDTATPGTRELNMPSCKYKVQNTNTLPQIRNTNFLQIRNTLPPFFLKRTSQELSFSKFVRQLHLKKYFQNSLYFSDSFRLKIVRCVSLKNSSSYYSTIERRMGGFSQNLGKQILERDRGFDKND